MRIRDEGGFPCDLRRHHEHAVIECLGTEPVLRQVSDEEEIAGVATLVGSRSP